MPGVPRIGAWGGIEEDYFPAQRRDAGRGFTVRGAATRGPGRALLLAFAAGCLAASQAASPTPAMPLSAVKGLFQLQQESGGGGTSALLQRWGEMQGKATPPTPLSDVEQQLARETMTESDPWHQIGKQSPPIADRETFLQHAIEDNGAGTWSPNTFARTSPIESDFSRWDSHSGGGTKRGRDGDREVMRAEVKDLRSTLREQAESLSSFRGLMDGALKAKDREVGKLRKRLEASTAKCQEAQKQAYNAQVEGEGLEKAAEHQQAAMEEMARMLQEANDGKEAKAAALRELEKTHEVTQMKLEDTQKAAETVQRDRDEAVAMLTAARQQMGVLIEEAKALREKGFSDTEQLALQSQRAHALQETVSSLESHRDSLQKDVEDALGGAAIKKMAQMQEEIDRLNSITQRLSAERELVDSERRRLHCEIQELRGNIRVVLRVRPLLNADERAGGQTLKFLGPQSPSGYGIELPVSGRKDPDGKPMRDVSHKFVFDSLLEPEASQEQAFGEVSELIRSVLNGYRVCVFAYGQTGSGKTFSMEGPPEGGERAHERRGLILRTVDKIFEDAKQLEERGWQLSIQVSFLEIYNEVLRDLLDNRYGFDKKMDVKIDKATGLTAVSNLITMEVLDSKAVESLLRRASKARATAATDCNERSSRSHSIFTLKVAAVHEGSQQEWTGVLNLVDLAGSERVSLSGAQGARLAETRSINKSLSSLGDVISALANKDRHVPYRNSRLTHLLQPCLGGNSKTLMLVNVSPAQQHLHETLCTLRFADKVSSCDLPTAQRSSRVKF